MFQAIVEAAKRKRDTAELARIFKSAVDMFTESQGAEEMFTDPQETRPQLRVLVDSSGAVRLCEDFRMTPLFEFKVDGSDIVQSDYGSTLWVVCALADSNADMTLLNFLRRKYEAERELWEKIRANTKKMRAHREELNASLNTRKG
jgi:hypothetical protein